MNKTNEILNFTRSYGAVKKISGTEDWIVESPFRWWVDYENQFGEVIVPKGFISNYGSIPRLLWLFENPTAWNSYILHDFLYNIKYNNNREMCDKCLLNAMIVEGCNVWKAYVIYVGVRLFGWLYW